MKLRRFLCSLTLSFVVLFGCANSGRSGKLVDTKSGPVRGSVSLSRLKREFYSWKGIPYAEPPVKELRYKDPLPVSNWSETLNALKYGPCCLQAVGRIPWGSEDCLKLHIFTPSDAFDNGLKLPVMFFIHGGEFEILKGETLVPDFFMDEDVLLVTFNYRLNSFGFLSTGDNVIRGNMGLKDQVMAMRWIKDNIEFFGGDPTKITIFGESAGGASVHYHLLSPMSRGLFTKAISQSGVANAVWAYGDTPKAQAKTFAKRLYCPTNSSEAMVACLRTKSAFEIIGAQQKIPTFGSPEVPRKQDFFLPTAEKVEDEAAFITSPPSELMKKGRYNAKVPWLTGINSHEGLLFTIPFVINPKMRQELERNWTEYAWIQLMLSPKERRKSNAIRSFYFGQSNLTSLEIVPQYIKMMSDRYHFVPLYKAANIRSQLSPGTTYVYHYAKRGPSLYNIAMRFPDRYPRVLGFIRGYLENWIDETVLQNKNSPGQFGVGHADELLMLGPLLNLYYVGEHHTDFNFSRDLVKLWVDFASNDGPWTFRGLNLTLFQPSNPQFFHIDCQPKYVKLNLEDRVHFWDSLSD